MRRRIYSIRRDKGEDDNSLLKTLLYGKATLKTLILKATRECNQQEARQRTLKSSHRPNKSRYNNLTIRITTNREKAVISQTGLTITLCQVKMASNRHKSKIWGRLYSQIRCIDQTLRIKEAWCIALRTCLRVRENKRWLATTIAWALAKAIIHRILAIFTNLCARRAT